MHENLWPVESDGLVRPFDLKCTLKEAVPVGCTFEVNHDVLVNADLVLILIFDSAAWRFEVRAASVVSDFDSDSPGEA